VSFVEKYNKNKAKMLANVGALANEISKAKQNLLSVIYLV
jgi:hypothetical protein